MKKSLYLLVFLTTFIFGAFVAFSLAFNLRSQRPISRNPIPLEITKENEGRRCEAKFPLHPAESPLCDDLHRQLAAAVGRNDLEKIKELLRKGANVDEGIAPDVYRHPPLSVAALNGNKETVILLLENGADVNKLGNWDTSALQGAVLHGQKDIAEILLENGANVCHEAHWDDLWYPSPTALDIAQKEGNLEIILLLMSFGAQRCSVW